MDTRPDPEDGTRITREKLLLGLAATGFGLSSMDILSACGGTGTAASTTATGKPRRGGRLKVGMVGLGNAESLNPASADDGPPNIVRDYLLYDTLIRATPASKLAPGLAEEWTPNQTYTEWTFKLRSGIKWHDGKPFTADDVLYTIRSMSNPSHNGAILVAAVDLNRIRKLDSLTVVLPLKQAQTSFPFNLTDAAASIIQNGTTDFTHPVGTGAFQYVSFTPGQQSVFKRNPDYWETGKPYVDELVITSIDDDAARLNALLSGAIDVMDLLPFTQAKVQQQSQQIKVLDTVSNQPYLFYMRVDVPPFNDVRVRQAFKYMVDRPAMVSDAISGFGAVSNDLVGKGLPFYNAQLPQREQDIERAKSLLKQAGHDSLTVSITSSTIQPGISEAATLFAQQAAAAGVTINVNNVPPGAFFDTSLQYLKYPFSSSFWTVSSLPGWYEEALAPGAPYNETHWHDPHWSSLLNQALAATSPSSAEQLWAEVQRIQWEEGGYIVWANVNNVDAARSNVNGIIPSRIAPLGAPTGLADAWLA